MNTIVGAMLGDFVGSVYEEAGIKGMMLPLTLPASRITDDSVMTYATFEALRNAQPFEASLRELCNKYAGAGFGSTMVQWLAGEDPNFINSNSNAAAIRISPIACLKTDLSEVLKLVERNASLTHTGEEAIVGACALAESIYLARHGFSRSAIKYRIEHKYHYALEYDAQHLFEHLTFTTDAAVTVPIAIWMGLTARGPLHCLRLGLHVGGDTDSITSMATALSASFASAVVPEQPYKALVRHLSINFLDFKAVLSIPQMWGH